MCVAIYQPPGTRLTKKVARKCYEANEDGAGFAWIEDGKMSISKGHFTFRSFWRAYRTFAAGKQAVVHFRIATAGPVNPINCHPFVVKGTDENPEIVMAHNGVLYSMPPGSKLSDTFDYVKARLRPIANKVDLFDEDIIALVEEAIGLGNKMVFLKSNGEAIIANESKGEWKFGMWFSNTSWEYKSNWCSYVAFKPKPFQETISSDDDDWDEYLREKYGSSLAVKTMPEVSSFTDAWPRYSHLLEYNLNNQEEWELAADLMTWGSSPADVVKEIEELRRAN